MQKPRNLISLLGGFAALVGYFLPFAPGRSLFHILENSPLPYFSLLMVLLAVLTMVLHSSGLSTPARMVSSALLLGWLFLLWLLLWVYSPAILAENLCPSACLLPLGLLAMALRPG